MARKELFIDVFETDTFNEWRLKTNSIKINLQDVYDELDTLDSRFVSLTGNQTVDGVKSFIQKSRWEQEYTENEVTPMLELRVTNSNSPRTSNHKGSGPSIDFYNPDTTASDPGVYDVGTSTQDAWLASRIASVSESTDDLNSNSSLIFYTSKNVRPLTEKMRITSDGEVGIGTANPKGQLSVQTSNDNSIISIQSKDSKYAAVTFGDSQSHKSGQIQYHNIGNSMRFFTGEDSTARSAERLRITSSGKVGIGITSPTEALDILGSLKSTGPIHSGEAAGGVALAAGLIPDIEAGETYHNANIAFNHAFGKPSISGSSARIETFVEESIGKMILQVGDNSIADATQTLKDIVELKTSSINLYADTKIDGKTNITGKLGVLDVENPDYALCVGARSDEAGHVALNAQGGAISLRPLRNTTHRWLLNALDNNGGKFQLTSGKWNTAKNTYDELPALTATTQGDITVTRNLKVNGITRSGQILIGDTWNTNGPAGGNLLYIKDQDSRSNYDPHGTADVNGNYAPDASTFPLIISDNNSNTSGPNSHGIVLYNSSGTPGSFAPSILFASRESNGTDFRSVNAGIYSRSPLGIGGSGRGTSEVDTNYNDGELIFATSGVLNGTATNSQGLTQRMVIDRRGHVGIGVIAPTVALDVEGNIKGRGDLIIRNDSNPEIEISDSSELNAYGISLDISNRRLIFGPKVSRGGFFTSRRTTINSLAINNNGSIDVRTGYLNNIDHSNDKSLITKKYVDDAVSGADIFGGLTSLSLNRNDEDLEGGELILKRSSDNTDYWHIDTHGSTPAPSLRFFHQNDGGDATVSMYITSSDRVGIKEANPDWDLCIGGRSLDPGSVAINAAGGIISLRPAANTTHAWSFNAFDAVGGDAAIQSRYYDRDRRRYRDRSVLRFTNAGDTFNTREFTANGKITSKSHVVAQGDLFTGDNVHYGSGSTSWLNHSRQNNSGDFFEIASRKADDSNWDYGKGFRQLKDGSVGIGKSPDAGYKLDVNGSIQFSSTGSIAQKGKITPTGFSGLTAKDVYSDGGTIAVGKAGDQAIYFDKDGNGFVKNRLTLGYTPSRASDAVTKSYVDSRIAGLDGTNEFTGRTNFDHSGRIYGYSQSHAGNLIPGLTGDAGHGGGFVSKFTTTSSSDGGGILIDVSDDNGDECAISAYNVNSKINKEIFHVRALNGDMYSAGDFYNRGNIGTEGNISIGESVSEKLSGWQIGKQQNTENLIFVYRNGSTFEQALSLLSDGRVSLHREGVSNSHLVTKKYVDDRVATNSDNIASNDAEIVTLTGRIDAAKTERDNIKISLNAKAPLDSPAFTGRPLSANPPTSDNHLANKKYVDDAVDGIAVNGSTGGSIGPHELFSVSHTDVATDVTPSYGDSIYYDGTEWTTGNFGNWGADMEYRGISSQSGATFSNVSYSGLGDRAKTLYARDSNGLTELFPGSAVNHSDSGTNKSGNFSGLKLTSKSPTSELDDSGTAIYHDQTYTISGKVQFPINGFSGTGLVNSKIRGLYIKSQVFMFASNDNREVEMYVTYPDGSKQPLLRTDKEKYMDKSDAFIAMNIEETIFVPVNEGQTQVEIEFNLNKSKAEGFGFEIIGALCTKRIELSPEVDLIQITGSQAAANNNDGYVGENTGSFGGANSVWSSTTPTTSPANNWSGVFPIEIPDNVYKTVIRTTNSWNSANSSHEESDHVTITIDWNEETIVGNQMFVEHITGIGFLYSENLVGEKTFTQESGLFPTKTKFELDGRSIIKLPCPGHDNGIYNNPSQNYTIENYKTIASTTKRLAEGFTTVGTTGTADTDGYLITEATFSNNTEIVIQIGTELFRDYKQATSGNAEVLTLPIAAGETWSIGTAGNNSNATFDVRFKAKSTEISDSNSFNLIDSGATGSFEITSTNVFQELDLSPIVGTNKTLVVMEVLGGTNSPQSNIYFKTNGSNIDSYTSGSAAGNGSAAVAINNTGEGGTVTVMTDANGKVSVEGEYTGTVYYKVQAYQGVVPESTTGDFSDASLTENGYQKLPNGFIMQWGVSDRTSAYQEEEEITFPIPFPNACLNVTGIADTAVIKSGTLGLFLKEFDTTTATFLYDVSRQSYENTAVRWQAYGH